MSSAESGECVVVAGVGRSGTSLVQAMLHAHPQVLFLPETHFFRQYLGPQLRRMCIERKGVAVFKEILEQDKHFARVAIEPADLLEPFSTEARQFAVRHVYQRLLELYRQRHQGVIVGDKDPRLIDFLPELHRLVPGVKVIHIIRDPRDVLVSRRKAAWSRDRSDLSHLFAYRAQMRRAKRTGPRFLGNRYLEVHYEELLLQPKETLDRVCRHIGVQYDASMMSFSDSAQALVAEDEWQWKKETVGPLMRDNLGKWEDELTMEARLLVEKLCIDPFPELGYSPFSECEGDSPSYRFRLFLWITQVVANMFARIYSCRTIVG